MIDRLIDEFNNEDYEDILQMFSDFVTFFKLLKKRNKLDRVLYRNYYGADWENSYLLFLKETDINEFRKEVETILDDVEYINGKAYLFGEDLSDLSVLFCDDRNGSDDIAGDLLGDKYDRRYDYYDTTDNIYDDVILELNDTNQERLKNYIINTLSKEEIYPNTDLLSEISRNQGHLDYVEINEESIDSILSDRESMDYLLEDYLPDLQSELFRLHSNAYSSAMESENYNQVWNELSEFFIGKPKWERVKLNTKDGSEKYREYFSIEINNFENDLVDFLKENKNYGERYSLSATPKYLDLLNEYRECLRLRLSDYPDHREIRNNINDMFEI